MNKITGIVLLVILGFSNYTRASDTLKITIQQADSLFLKKSFQLLVAGLNIDAKNANIIQAKLYPNPIFTADVNAYDPSNDRAFHVGSTGQKAFQLEQLVLLGGKRKALIDLAKTESNIAQLEFQELLLQLKYELRSSFYLLDQQSGLIQKYTNQLTQLKTIIDAYEIQAQKGNLPLKDVVRLKGVYIDLSSQKSECIRQYTDDLIKLQLLLQSDQVIMPVTQSSDLESKIKVLSVEDLVRDAMTNRPDYLIAQQYKTHADQQYLLQKSLAVPDVNVFTSYDQRGGAFGNQINAGFSIPLPVWNRNQGAIKIAQIEQQQNELKVTQTQMQVNAEVSGYYSLYNRAIKDYQRASGLYNDDFEVTLKGMSENFRNGNISLIEFVDFFESYNQAISDLAKVKVQLIVAAEQLNFIIGKELF